MFQFKDGKTSNYSGLAIVDDGGKTEPILRADGSVEISGGTTPRLTYLAAKDIVLPDLNALVSMSASGAGRNLKEGYAGDESNNILRSEMSSLRSAVHGVKSKIKTCLTPLTSSLEVILSKSSKMGKTELLIITTIHNSSYENIY